MNDTDEKTLYDLADVALGEETVLDLGYGITVERAGLGNILLNGKMLVEAPAGDIEGFVKQAREWVRTKHTRPESNPFIKID